eukprot:3446151-Prymnesium_polylepis.1
MSECSVASNRSLSASRLGTARGSRWPKPPQYDRSVAKEGGVVTSDRPRVVLDSPHRLDLHRRSSRK